MSKLSEKAAALIAVKKVRAIIEHLRACGKQEEADVLEAALEKDFVIIFKS